MNPQQLQSARAALWRQNAAGSPAAENSTSALLTTEDAARWIEDIGFCLFLPRHTQFPAPAPSFVEACLGAASVTPPPAAIATATEFAARLVLDDRAIPLSLLGTYTEQPDFLTTPEVLPWVAAIRGDRQWKAAPAGRTAPLIVRTWELLDREGTATAAELRESLGHEITEAAVLRSLISLWTGLRAIPLPAPGEPTRWTLLKHRFPEQLSTAANTAQATALSALLSLYLRSAVAASAEEAEVFLSPLTSRSRIREVLHGMMAARQFATMSVGSQTLLFVEGSLPETVDTEPAAVGETVAKPSQDRPRPWRKDRRPSGPPSRREERGRPFASARGSEPRRDRQGSADETPRRSRERHEKKPWQRREAGPQKFGSRPPRREGGAERSEKPWQRREGRPDNRGSRPQRPWQRREPGQGRSNSQPPWQRREPGPQSSGSRPSRPWQKRSPDQEGDDRESRGPSERRPPAKFRPGSRDNRPWRKPAARPGRPWQDRKRARPENRPEGASPERNEGKDRRRERPNRPPRKFGPGADRRPSFRPARSEDRGGDRPGPANRPSRFSGDRSRQPAPASKKFVKKRFPKANSSPGKPKPRKNRNQEESPE